MIFCFLQKGHSLEAVELAGQRWDACSTAVSAVQGLGMMGLGCGTHRAVPRERRNQWSGKGAGASTYSYLNES